MVVRPFQSRVKAAPSVELAGFPLGRLPLGGGLGEMAVDAKALAVAVDPVPQGGPLGDQRLVGHLHGWLTGLGVSVKGEQSGVTEGVDHLDHVPVRAYLAAGHPPPGVGGTLADGDESGEQPPGGVPVSARHRPHQLVGPNPEGAGDSPEVLVARPGQEAAIGPVLVEQGQRVLKQGQGARPLSHVGQDLRNQPFLEVAAGGSGRGHDRLFQFVGRQGVTVIADALVSSANSEDLRGRS